MKNPRLSARVSLVLVPLAAGYLLCSASPARADFGVTDAGGFYTVDTDAGLVFKVNEANGDITSLLYKGLELQGQTKMSHISSGLGKATVSAEMINPNLIKITSVTPTLTHYFLVRRGQNIITMATYITAEPPVGELRWITRLNGKMVPNGPPNSNNAGNTGAIESKDVFGYPDGHTTSKYYLKERAMDLTIRGATGSGVGVYMDYGNRETSSGGPFFRDIQNQAGGDQEVYNYMNSGHNQTEPVRTGLHGPYALVFTDGTTQPARVDYSWMDSAGLNLQGWVGLEGRGVVRGRATGVPAGFQAVVGFANAASQGWCKVDPATGQFTSPRLKAGDYTMTLYKGELAVASQPVTVKAGEKPVTMDIASAEPHPASLWRIGEWDGTPAGFWNAENITIMHPSDVREKPWAPVTYSIGTSDPSIFPSEQWSQVNSPTTIKFNLSPDQVKPLTLRIGITCAYAGGRPTVGVNAWNAPIPEATSQPKSRSLTIGTYRGNNTTLTYQIPVSALVAGENTITLNVAGHGNFTRFLSPGYAYDCVELDQGE
jgi:rhamnogalacturonan endolyase